MRETEIFYDSLLKLNQYEELGRLYEEKYGEEMGVYQYAWLLNSPESCHTIEAVITPEAVAQQQKIMKEYRQLFTVRGLSEQYYLPKGKDYETEQLMRHIHVPRHKHDFIEMVCVLGGECDHMIDNEHYLNRPGDFTIIPPATEHELRGSEDCVCLTTKFRTSAFSRLFSPVMMDVPELAAYFNQTINDRFYRQILMIRCGEDELFRDTALLIYMQQLSDKPHAGRIITGLWNVLMTYMLQNYLDTVTFLTSDAVAHEEMLHILAYIYENYRTVTLAEAADHFHFSVPYLSHRIRQITGRTFSQHLKSYKLQRSAELLRETSLRLDLICDQVGYSDTAQFVRSFKEAYGMTPVRYRKQALSEKQEA